MRRDREPDWEMEIGEQLTPEHQFDGSGPEFTIAIPEPLRWIRVALGLVLIGIGYVGAYYTGGCSP